VRSPLLFFCLPKRLTRNGARPDASTRPAPEPWHDQLPRRDLATARPVVVRASVARTSYRPFAARSSHPERPPHRSRPRARRALNRSIFERRVDSRGQGDWFAGPRSPSFDISAHEVGAEHRRRSLRRTATEDVDQTVQENCFSLVFGNTTPVASKLRDPTGVPMDELTACSNCQGEARCYLISLKSL
jgi:hypothetical protein